MEFQNNNLKGRLTNLKIVRDNLTEIEDELNIKLEATSDTVDMHINLLEIFLDDEAEEEDNL